MSDFFRKRKEALSLEVANTELCLHELSKLIKAQTLI